MFNKRILALASSIAVDDFIKLRKIKNQFENRVKKQNPILCKHDKRQNGKVLNGPSANPNNENLAFRA